MPNIKSAAKRMRQNAKRRTANRANRSALRTAVKKVETAVAQGDAQGAQASLQPALRLLGKGAQKGLIHQHKAARHCSHLTRKVNAIQS